MYVKIIDTNHNIPRKIIITKNCEIVFGSGKTP